MVNAYWDIFSDGWDVSFVPYIGLGIAKSILKTAAITLIPEQIFSRDTLSNNTQAAQGLSF